MKLQIAQKNAELSYTTSESVDWYKYLGKLVVSIKHKCLANPLTWHSKYKLSASVGLCAGQTCPGMSRAALRVLAPGWKLPTWPSTTHYDDKEIMVC